MRTIALFAALVATAILPAAAQAVEFVSVDGVADCNGWSSNVVIWFRAGARSVDLSYDVVLTGADGVEIQRFTAAQDLPISPDLEVTFTFSGVFATPPAQGSTLTGQYVLHDNFTDGFNEFTAGFLAVPDCTPPVDDPSAPMCTHTARWWQRHHGEWPADELDVGGENWDGRTLHRVLSRPAWGNVRMLLARQLVAAKFNALTNPGADMTAAINAADAYLADEGLFRPVHRRGRGRDLRREAAEVRALMRPLVEFNELGCMTEPNTLAEDGDLSDVQLVDKVMAGEVVDPGTDEDVSFGTLKARFR